MTASTEALDHVTRAPLPWRDDLITECGRPAETVASTIDAHELEARIARDGQRRAAYTVCMTCWSRVSPYAPTWERFPIGVLAREMKRVGLYEPIGDPLGPGAQRLTAELRALAALAHAHRDEFNTYLADLDATVDLTQTRRDRPRRRTGSRR